MHLPRVYVCVRACVFSVSVQCPREGCYDIRLFLDQLTCTLVAGSREMGLRGGVPAVGNCACSSEFAVGPRWNWPPCGQVRSRGTMQNFSLATERGGRIRKARSKKDNGVHLNISVREKMLYVKL